MPSFNRTLHSALPAWEVFSYMADFSNVSDWDPSLTEAERLNDGEIGKGSRFRVVAEIMGRETEMLYEHEVFSPPHSFVSVTDTKTFSSRDMITVEPEGEGCALTYDAQLTLHGPLKLATPLVQLGFSRNSGKAADRLAEKISAS